MGMVNAWGEKTNNTKCWLGNVIRREFKRQMQEDRP